MADIDREDIERRLEQLHKKLSLIEKSLDVFTQDCIAKGDTVLPALVEALAELKENQEATRTAFHQSLAPFFEGDIQLIQLSQLPDEVFPVVVGTDKEAELVGLAERLEGLQKTGDERHERINELMRDFHIAPKPSSAGIVIGESSGDSRKRKLFDHFEDIVDLPSFDELFGEDKERIVLNPKSDLHLTPADIAAGMLCDVEVKATQEAKENQETEEAKGTQQTDEEAGNVLRLSDIAMEMYGFSVEIATDVDKSLQHRKLVQDDIQFLEDEAEIGLDDLPDYIGKGKGKKQEDGTEIDSWVMIQKMNMKFEKLKRVLYKPKEADDEDPCVLMQETFLRVIRNWVFHIESVIVRLVYEIREMISGNEAAEAAFRELESNLKMLKEVENGMVPIAAYKVLALVDRPVVSRMSTGEGRNSSSQQLQGQMDLIQALDSIHGIMVRLQNVLVTAGLSNTRLIDQAEVDSYEATLKGIEVDLKEVEQTIKYAK